MFLVTEIVSPRTCFQYHIEESWCTEIEKELSLNTRLFINTVLFSFSAGPVMEDWDIISPKDVIGSEQLFVERTKSLASAALPFTQSLLTQVHSPF